MRSASARRRWILVLPLAFPLSRDLTGSCSILEPPLLGGNLFLGREAPGGVALLPLDAVTDGAGSPICVVGSIVGIILPLFGREALIVAADFERDQGARS